MPNYSILDKVRAKLKNQPLNRSIEESIKWYRRQIRELSGYSSDPHYSRGSGLRKDLLEDKTRARSNYLTGQMYCFCYDPKHKKTLKYFDKFPLVFFIGPSETDSSILGINLHYLGYRQRLLLFNELATLANNRLTNPQTKLILAYKMLKGFARFKAVKPTLHKYLPDHIVSRLVKIEAPDWETALFLPVENFSKRSKTFVWADSDRIISGEQKGPTGLPKNSDVPHTSTTANPVNQNGLPHKI
jgi:hypothetical protein